MVYIHAEYFNRMWRMRRTHIRVTALQYFEMIFNGLAQALRTRQLFYLSALILSKHFFPVFKKNIFHIV